MAIGEDESAPHLLPRDFKPPASLNIFGRRWVLINPSLPNGNISSRAKIFDFNLRRDHQKKKKKIYESRDYVSEDEKSLS